MSASLSVLNRFDEDTASMQGGGLLVDLVSAKHELLTSGDYTYGSALHTHLRPYVVASISIIWFLFRRIGIYIKALL